MSTYWKKYFQKKIIKLKLVNLLHFWEHLWTYSGLFWQPMVQQISSKSPVHRKASVEWGYNSIFCSRKKLFRQINLENFPRRSAQRWITINTVCESFPLLSESVSSIRGKKEHWHDLNSILVFLAVSRITSL